LLGAAESIIALLLEMEMEMKRFMQLIVLFRAMIEVIRVCLDCSVLEGEGVLMKMNHESAE
jgi:hypothetical protein